MLELLIVIAILAVLATVAVLVINPLEYIKQSRDTKRIADLDALSKAIQLYDFNSTASSTATFASTIVYLSLPDNTSTTCGSYTLPALPVGYRYNCVPQANLQKTDGTGWVPLNLSSIPGGSPVASLPVDPTNDATSRDYYSFVPGGSFELASAMESTRYRTGGDKDATSKDGGPLLGLYETGTNLSLMPIDYGDPSLVGYWSLDEGSGSIARDKSGNNVTGTITGTPSWVAGKIGGALSFDGSTNSITIANPITQTNNAQEWSVTTWAKLQTKSTQTLMNLNNGIHLVYSTTNKLLLYLNDGTNDYYDYGNYNLQDNAWHHIAFVFKNSTGVREIYIDGVDVSTTGPNMTSTPTGIPPTITIGSGVLGLLDDIRIYNRQLSAQEVRGMYNAGK